MVCPQLTLPAKYLLVNYKLPSLKIVVATIYFAWANKAELLRAISVPTLVLALMLAVGAALIILFDKPPRFLSWIFLFAFALSSSFFAITCHRLILIGSAHRFKSFNAMPGYRELRFLGWSILIYSVVAILEIPFMAFAKTLVGESAEVEGGRIADWVKDIGSIPAYYVFARLCLVFPAAAIDGSPSLRWSWERTQDNGWRIFAVAGLFPWLIEKMIEFLFRNGATTLEQVLLSILFYIGLAIGIIALSFTYKEFEKRS